MGIANNQFNWGRRFSCLSWLLLCHFPFLCSPASNRHTHLFMRLGLDINAIVAGMTVILLCVVLIMVMSKF